MGLTGRRGNGLHGMTTNGSEKENKGQQCIDAF